MQIDVYNFFIAQVVLEIFVKNTCVFLLLTVYTKKKLIHPEKDVDGIKHGCTDMAATSLTTEFFPYEFFHACNKKRFCRP